MPRAPPCWAYDEHEPGPDGLVRRDRSRRLRLQLRYRRADLLVDDGVDVVRGDGRPARNSQVGDVEGKSSQDEQERQRDDGTQGQPSYE